MMQSSEIKGLSVFSIADGKEIGKVKDLLINADKKAVDYLVIEIPNWYFGSHVIAFNLIEGMGKDAIVIESDNIVKDLNEEPASIELVERGIKLVGSRVLTKKGRIIGKINEYYVNIETGQVTGCVLSDQDDHIQGIIPAGMAITFGKDALVVQNEAENNLADSITECFEEQTSVSKSTDMAANQVTVEKAIDEEDNIMDALKKPDDQIIDDPSLTLFEQRQREYLLGRVVKNNIKDTRGNIIVKKGEVITKEIIDKVDLAGKLKEMMLDV